jgi:hypothetical protein
MRQWLRASRVLEFQFDFIEDKEMLKSNMHVKTPSEAGAVQAVLKRLREEDTGRSRSRQARGGYLDCELCRGYPRGPPLHVQACHGPLLDTYEHHEKGGGKRRSEGE